MPISSGPNTAGESNLVFNYDTGDTINSYKGEPTTNLVPYSEYQYLADGYTEALGGWDTYEGTMLIDANNKVPGYTNRSIKMTCVQANVYKYHFSVPLTNGQTYTVSFWGKAAVASAYGNFLLADGPGGYLVFEPGGYSSVTTEFTRFKYTFTVSSPTGTYNFATYLYGDGSIVWLSGFQIENKSYATQYLPSNVGPTTRSNTQGLLDISGYNNSISLANMSFDSNAQPTFDATDDFIDLGTDKEIKSSGGWTVESLVYYNAVAGTYNNTTSPANFIGSETISYNSWYWSVLDNKLALWNISPGVWKYGSTTLQANRWYHAVLVCYESGTQYQMYLNGVAEGGDHASYSWNPTYSGLKIRYIGKGNNANTRLVNGRINITRVYNRSLLASEIAQNYNQLKTRFNLS